MAWYRSLLLARIGIDNVLVWKSWHEDTEPWQGAVIFIQLASRALASTQREAAYEGNAALWFIE